MISSPLFISVAESIVILAPIFHVGCCSASSTVTVASRAFGVSRKGPPDAVRRTRWTSARLWPARHWKTALCSESTGRSFTPRARAAAVIRLPATTSVSLLASATVRPARIAALVGRGPPPPTSAQTATSASPARRTRPAPNLRDRAGEVGGAEVRPERRRDPQLGVGVLPQEEVRHAHLAARRDQEVGARNAGGVGGPLDPGPPDVLGPEPPRLHLPRE